MRVRREEGRMRRVRRGRALPGADRYIANAAQSCADFWVTFSLFALTF